MKRSAIRVDIRLAATSRITLRSIQATYFDYFNEIVVFTPVLTAASSNHRAVTVFTWV